MEQYVREYPSDENGKPFHPGLSLKERKAGGKDTKKEVPNSETKLKDRPNGTSKDKKVITTDNTLYGSVKSMEKHTNFLMVRQAYREGHSSDYYTSGTNEFNMEC